MGTNDGENKEKNFDDISDLLKKYYKPKTDIDINKLWEETSQKIDSLFHKELLSEKGIDSEGNILSDQMRYWMGMEEYVENKTSSLKHKAITDHLLRCKECRQNYIKFLDKKKLLSDGTLAVCS